LGAAPPEPPPNVVFILADDLGWGDLGCYGQTKIRTPHVDRIAREGMRFRRAYAGAPVCAPSRCILLSGKHAGHAFIRDNREVKGAEGQLAVPEGTCALPLMMRGAGYRTAAVGKWGLGGADTVGAPNRQGIDHFFGHLCQRVAHSHYTPHLWRNDRKVPLEGNTLTGHEKITEPPANEQEYYRRFNATTYAPELMAREALEFIRVNRDRPFFLYYCSPIPHAALQVPSEKLDAYPREWDPKPYLGDKGYLPHPRPRAAYAAMVSELDAQVGRILALLDELGLAGRTIVFFSSDNGPAFDYGGHDSDFFKSAGELRGRKGSVYEGGIRTPLVVRWPGRIAAGAVTDHEAAFWDVLPTVAELTGASPPAGGDGVSFAPTLLGEAARQKRHEHLYWEHNQRQQAVRMGPLKAVRPRPGAPLELYDLAADPGEQSDLAGARPEFVARAEELLRTLRVESAEFPLGGRR
jgi:arylsulfatase A-like enzyme